MVGRVEGQRQVEHVLEVASHRGEPVAVGEPVGVQGDEHARRDGEEAEADPGEDQRQHRAHGIAAALEVRQVVDDPAHQQRFREGRHREHEVGRGEPDGQPPVRLQETQDAPV